MADQNERDSFKRQLYENFRETGVLDFLKVRDVTFLMSRLKFEQIL